MPDFSQTIVFNAVRGAVINAMHGHPEWQLPNENFARSVAKRAAGTLAGMHPGVALAAARRSGQRRTFSTKGADAGERALANDARSLYALRRLHGAITLRITGAHQAGDSGRFLELCTAARIIKREIERAKEGQP